VKHLGDEEIQAYLDGGAAADAGRAADHLRECPVCRRVCEEYGMLYEALADDSHVCGPARVAIGAAAARSARAGRPRAASLSDAFVTGGAIAAALAAAVWVFVNVGGAGPGASRVVSALAELFRRAVGLSAPLGHTGISANSETGLIVAAGLVTCAALALDRLLLAPHLAGARPPERKLRP
jgi:predicted anti-sigma-YlaC factor YlaD